MVFPSPDCKSKALHTPTTKLFYSRQSPLFLMEIRDQHWLQNGQQLLCTGNLGSRNTSPRDLITEIAVSFFPQALTRPVREKISSGDDCGSHTYCNKHFQISCLPAYYYCYSLFAKRWQKAKYNQQKNRELHSSHPRNLRLVLHSVPPGYKSGLFFASCLSNRINEQVERLALFAWLGRDHLNSLNSQSLQSLQVVKTS